MVILSSFDLIRKGTVVRGNREYPVYLVAKPDPQPFQCRFCDGVLHVVDYRYRYLITDEGEKIVLKVRQYRCSGESCPHRWHRELPGCAIPYRHPTAGTAERLYPCGKQSGPGTGSPAGEAEAADSSAMRPEKQDDYEAEGLVSSTHRGWLVEFVPGCKKAFASLKAMLWDNDSLKKKLDELINLDPCTAPPGWLRQFVQVFVNSGIYIPHRSLFFVR